MPLLKCAACGFYTLQEQCARCPGKATKPGPAKYGPEDPYGKYRRIAKQQLRKRAG